MPHGWGGLIFAMAIIMFSFGGLELVGLAAAKQGKPALQHSKAINQVVYRILIFYIGSITVILFSLSVDKIVENVSPVCADLPLKSAIPLVLRILCRAISICGLLMC